MSPQQLKAGFGGSSESADFLGAAEFIESLQRHTSVEEYRENPAAGLRMSHYVAAYTFDLPVVRESRFRLAADLGLGATRLTTVELAPYGNSGRRVSETYLSFRGAITLEYRFSPDCLAFLTGREFLYLDDTRLAMDELGNSSQVIESGRWTFPLSFGLRLSVN